MKHYRCIFKYGNGQTTFKVEAHDAASALAHARQTVVEKAQAIEVWDETGLVTEQRETLPTIRACAAE